MYAKSLVFASALFLLTPMANADPVRYQFFSDSTWDFGLGSIQGSFTYTADNFITAPDQVFANQLSSCSVTAPAGGSCGGFQGFHPNAQGVEANYDLVGFYVTGTAANGNPVGLGNMYSFPLGAFSAVGSYVSSYDGNPTAPMGRLVVTAVPEPETYAMMLAGLGALGLIACRKKRE